VSVWGLPKVFIARHNNYRSSGKVRSIIEIVNEQYEEIEIKYEK
jgi:hypothetical protein